jgi:hypothetical protein
VSATRVGVPLRSRYSSRYSSAAAGPAGAYLHVTDRRWSPGTARTVSDARASGGAVATVPGAGDCVVSDEFAGTHPVAMTANATNTPIADARARRTHERERVTSSVSNPAAGALETRRETDRANAANARERVVIAGSGRR